MDCVNKFYLKDKVIRINNGTLDNMSNRLHKLRYRRMQLRISNKIELKGHLEEQILKLGLLSSKLGGKAEFFSR